MLPRCDDEKFLGLRHSERLQKLKPTIIQLYMEYYGTGGRRMTLRQITEFMRDRYAFHIALVANLSGITLCIDVPHL